MTPVKTTRENINREHVYRGKLTVQASFIAQEADFAVAVAPHETQDDGFFLPALEAVDAA